MTSANCFFLLHQQATLWTDLAAKTAEMLVASAQVIGHRTGRLAAAGPLPSTRDQREFALMGREKFDAATASATAMGRHGLSIGSGLGMQAWHDLFEAGNAMLSIASSRSVQQSVERQAALARTLARSAASASRLTLAGAQIAVHGLQPIHTAATANAQRLAGPKR